jgi:hypothetical protein
VETAAGYLRGDWRIAKGEFMNLSKKVVLMILAGSIFLPGLQSDLNAACSRSDLEFYLKKGFSHEQITAICSSSEGDAAAETPTEPEIDSTGSETPRKNSESTGDLKEVTSVPAQEDTFSLTTVIKGYDVDVGPESMHYTTSDCFEYGEEDIFGFRRRACPEIRFSIYYDGMEASKSGMKYFFYGPRGIKVKGRIERQILSGLDHLGKEARKEALKELESGDETTIPIHKGISLDKALNALKDLHASRPN